MRAVYITGFMGAGKTTVGKLLGEKLQLPVRDTDLEIEQAAGKSIRAIFAEEGEAYFREAETNMLHTMPIEDVIITTGGGIVGRAENRDWMKEYGTVIYLYCSPEAIIERLQGDTTRPLLQADNLPAFYALFESRQPLYEQAHIQVDTTGKSVAEIVTELEQAIKQR